MMIKKYFLLYSMMKTVVLTNIFVETLRIFFSFLFMKFKRTTYILKNKNTL